MVNPFVDLGKNLKAHRECAGYSQEQFSALCEISRQSLHKHETGKVKPTPEHLARYAVALGIPVTNLSEKIHPKAWNFRVFDTLAWKEHGDKL